MKTNKITKWIIALLAALTIFSLTAAAFAQTETESQKEESSTQAEPSAQEAAAPEKPGKKDGKNRPGHPCKDDDWFEDWFEHRIEAREGQVDFSELPENPTDEELMDFFKKNFMGERPDPKSDGETKTDSDISKEEKPSRDDMKKHHHEKGHGFGSDSQPMNPPAKGEKRPMPPMKHHDDRADRFEDWFENRIDARKHGVDFTELPENPTDEEIVEFFRKNFLGDNSATKEK